MNRTIFFATISFLTGFGVIIVWYFGGEEVVEDRLTLGTRLAFYSYMWMVYGRLEWFGPVNHGRRGLLPGPSVSLSSTPRRNRTKMFTRGDERRDDDER